MPADPPYRLDPYQNIVNVHWPSGGLYVVIFISSYSNPWYNGPKSFDYNGNETPFTPTVNSHLGTVVFEAEYLIEEDETYDYDYFPAQDCELDDIFNYSAVHSAGDGMPPTLLYWQLNDPSMYAKFTTPIVVPPDPKNFFGFSIPDYGLDNTFHEEKHGVFSGSYSDGPANPDGTLIIGASYDVRDVNQYDINPISGHVHRVGGTRHKVIVLSYPKVIGAAPTANEDALTIHLGGYAATVTLSVLPSDKIELDPSNDAIGPPPSLTPNGNVYWPFSWIDPHDLPIAPDGHPWAGDSYPAFDPTAVPNTVFWQFNFGTFTNAHGGIIRMTFTLDDHLLHPAGGDPNVTDPIFEAYPNSFNGFVDPGGYCRIEYYYINFWRDLPYGTAFGTPGFEWYDWNWAGDYPDAGPLPKISYDS